MPRPPYKRTKLNHPQSPRRVADVSHISPRTELQQKLANKPIGRVPSDSDDSDRLVTKNRTGRNRRGVPRKEIYASGGVAKGDIPGAHKSGAKSTVPLPAKRNKGIAITEREIVSASPRTQQQPHNNLDVQREILPKNNASLAKRTISSTSGPISMNEAPTRVPSTPGVESSILGTIKPRRRQPSILRMVDNYDSSNLVDEDEDDFLPNDESTPLNLSNSHAFTSTPNSSLSQRSGSRKRKLSPPITLVPMKQVSSSQINHVHSKNNDNLSGSEPSLPSTTKLKNAKSSTPTKPKDADIMAPPRSSSPLKSPQKPPKQIRQNPKSILINKPSAPTTSALQSLMPVRRRQAERLRSRTYGEFEIPSDSSQEADGSGHDPVSDHDDSNFVLGKKTRRSGAAGRNQAKLSKKAKSASARTKVGSRTIQSTRSPAEVVTQLRRPAAAESTAKSSSLSQQQQALDGKSGVTVKTTYTSRRRGAISIADKENHIDEVASDFPSSRIENSIEIGGDDSCVEQSKTKPKSKEIISLAKKFAVVDEWEMDFEDVTVESESSYAR